MTQTNRNTQSHTVKRGENLSTIAKHNRTSVQQLVRDNPALAKNPNLVRTGQRLVIADRFERSPGASNQPRSAPSSAARDSGFVDGPASRSGKPSSAPAGEELGSLSRRYEAKGPGTVSTGKGDRGGVSYGSYQFASKTGSAQKFVDGLKTTHPSYHQALAGKKPGSPEFSAAWKQLAAKDPKGFDRAQHEAIAKTHYEPSAAKIKGDTGVDLNSRSKALRDVAWSTSVQHGPKNDIFKKALAGKDPSKMSDADIIKAVYAERGRKGANGSLVHFSKNSPAVQRSVSERFKSEQKEALKQLATPAGSQKGQGGSATPTPKRTDGSEGSRPTPTPKRTDGTEGSRPTPTPKRTGGTDGPTPYDPNDKRQVTPSGTKPSTHVNTPFYSQFENGHGFEAGKSACFKAATAMAKASGATVTGPDKRIQIGTSEDSNGHLKVDSQKAAQGRSYIESQLASGKPVVVGVSHKGGYGGNVDKMTDHFVVVTGRGTDEKGRAFYTFNDPATGNRSVGADTNPKNRFYIDDKTGAMYKNGATASGMVVDRHFEVAMVRPNA